LSWKPAGRSHEAAEEPKSAGNPTGLSLREKRGSRRILRGCLSGPFIEGETFQGQQRPDHVFSDPLGLFLCLDPDPAVDIEPRVSPGEKAFRPFGAEELLEDKIDQDLAGEEPGQPRDV
jgi:hypothetical protein